MPKLEDWPEFSPWETITRRENPTQSRYVHIQGNASGSPSNIQLASPSGVNKMFKMSAALAWHTQAFGEYSKQTHGRHSLSKPAQLFPEPKTYRSPDNHCLLLVTGEQ